MRVVKQTVQLAVGTPMHLTDEEGLPSSEIRQRFAWVLLGFGQIPISAPQTFKQFRKDLELAPQALATDQVLLWTL